MAYKEAGSVSAETWDFNEDDDTVEGKYEGKKEGVGENNSTIYYVKLDNGDTVAVWGSTVLDRKMEEVDRVSKDGKYIRIKIVRGSQKPSPNRKGKYYWDFSVLYDEEYVPL